VDDLTLDLQHVSDGVKDVGNLAVGHRHSPVEQMIIASIAEISACSIGAFPSFWGAFQKFGKGG
jgi:hypothetical protein